MDDPYIKLLLLIVPAVLFVAQIVLSPLLEEMKFKNKLIKKTITVQVLIFEDDTTEVEQYTIDGTIQKNNEGRFD